MWIEFFAKSPQTDSKLKATLAMHILEGNVAIIHPIRAELLSGHLTAKTRSTIEHCLNALQPIDADWHDKNTWDAIITLSETAHKKGLAIPGVVDRMIIVAAQRAQASIWTKDKGLSKLADLMGLSIKW
jgi:hypothetical protein